MIKKLYILFILIQITPNLIAQKRANNWALGNYQINFNDGSPVIEFGYADYLNRGIGMISDENGNLLFYSDGFSIWNKNHQLMPSGTELIPSHETTSKQESIVVPNPSNDQLYYLFTVDPWNGQTTSGLYYSIIDLSLDSGLGDVTTKGEKILNNTTNKISATFHANLKDYWVVVHEHSTNNYYSFLVNAEGVSGEPILNQIGKEHRFRDGQLKFSPDGKRLACSRQHIRTDNTALDLFDFDPETGQLSGEINLILPADRDCEGLDFSSDAKKLYVAQGGSTGERGLYQFDLEFSSQEEIQNSRKLLHREVYNGFNQLQLAPDGKIYITKGGGGGGTAHLGVISNLNDLAENVTVEENGLFLEGGSSFVNYTPNFIQNYFFKTSFLFDGNCQSSSIYFRITNTHLLESVQWNFGEGSISTELNPVHVYDEPGTYSVTLTANYADHSDKITKDVVINPFPILELGEDRELCFGSKILVDDLFVNYRWSTDDTTITTRVQNSGYYALEVTNEYGCTSTDSIYVNVVELPEISLLDSLFIENDQIEINPGQFTTYSWSTNETTQSIMVSQPGWYSVLVTNNFGCESFKSVYVSDGSETIFEPDSWIRLSPKPTSLTGNDVFFVDEFNGFIVNSKELIVTNDQGDHWSKFMDLDLGYRISFKDGYGFIIGQTGSVYKSTYKGGGWNKLEVNLSDNLNSITLLNKDSIFVTGDNTLFKSFDGGESWEAFNIPNVDVEDAYFVNKNVGHVACTNGTILKTTDGGASWYTTITSNVTPSNFFRITFINEFVGYASQEHNDIYKTTDGGESWTEIISPPDAAYSIQFLDEQIGFIAGDHGAMHKTLDGGNTWDWIGFDGRKGGNTLNSVMFLNQNEGFATGYKGRIIRTKDGGRSWEDYSTIYGTISQMNFTSAEVGFLRVGNEIFNSLDNGESWLSLGAPLPDKKTGQFDFINDTIGFAIVGGSVGTSGNSGSVYKTTNGGISWVKAHESFELITENLYCIDFIDESLGFVSGGFNQDKVLKTTDGGQTWSQVESVSFGQIQFLNKYEGYARNVGNLYNRIYKTTNGGDSWNITFEIDEDINSFHFINDSVGYFAGDNALIYRTFDGGDSWQELDIPYEDYEYVKFFSNYQGYILDEEGQLYRTMDGGESWESLHRSYGINSIELRNMKIYLSGENGSILKSSIDADELIDIKQLSLVSVTDSTATVNAVVKSSLNKKTINIELGVQSGSYENTFELGSYYDYSNSINYSFKDLEPSTEYFCRLVVTDGNLVRTGQEFSFTSASEQITGIGNDKKRMAFSIYPNPANNSIKIEELYNHFLNNYSILSLDGRIMKVSEIPTNGIIDISHIDNGIYFLRLKSIDGHMATEKFIKK